MTGLKASSGGPVRPAAMDKDALLAALEEAVKAVAGEVAARGPAYPQLWQVQAEQMRRELRRYLLNMPEAGELNAECLHFELAFGPMEGGQRSCDPASRAEPITLQTPAGAVRIRGCIDRVDRVNLAGEPGLLVVDYKSGAIPRSADVEAGRNLQLPIYVAAAEQALGAECLGGAFHRIGGGPKSVTRRYFAGLSVSRGKVKAEEGFDLKRQAVAERIGEFIAAMRAGRFDVLPTHDCPSYCPFRQVCGFAEARADRKRAVEPGGGE
jgi:hypothetical protein